MEIISEASYALRIQHLRAGVRGNSRVRVMVEWGEPGQTHSVSGYTVDISPEGCLAVVPQGLRLVKG